MKKQTKHIDLISSPSNFYRVELCRGSAALEEQAPQGATSPAAERGKALHASLAARIEARFNGKKNTVKTPKGEADNLDAWEGFLAENISSLFSSGDVPKVETEVEISMTHLGFDHRGFADYIVTDGDRALVIDFKSGPGPFPTPTKDWQLRLYALALMAKRPKVKEWSVAFYSPERQDGRPYFDMDQFRDTEGLIGIVEQVLGEARQPGADLTPSLHACRYCRAKSLCPAILQEPAVSGALAIASPVLRYAPGMTVEQFLSDSNAEQRAKFLEGLTLAGKWVESAEEACLALAQTGVEFAGFEVRSKMVTKAWKDETDAEALLLSVFGAQAYEKKMLTPAAALKKAANEEQFGSEAKAQVAAFIEERPSKPGLYKAKGGKP